MEEKRENIKGENANDRIPPEAIEEMIMQAVEENGKELSEKKRKELIEAMRKSFIGGMSVKDAIGLDEQTANQFYRYAYTRYYAGKFVDAMRAFSFLSVLDRKSPRYRMGTAASFHKMKEYRYAAFNYLECANLDRASPIPYYHAADCFMKMDKPLAAFYALYFATSRCGNDPVYAKLKTKCVTMMKALYEKAKAEVAQVQPSSVKTEAA